MRTLQETIARIIELREGGQAHLTLLAACPNSATVLEAAVIVAAAYTPPVRPARRHVVQ